MTDDTLTVIDGRPSLRFERRLPHRVEPPRRLEWTFAGELYRFELTVDADATVLVFTHRSHDPALAAQTATGWHTYLLRLEPLLDGGFLSEDDAHAGWEAAHERYAERFGVDPGPGREFAAALRGQPR